MTQLDDLLRETMARRAHDVDAVPLPTRPRARRPSRRRQPAVIAATIVAVGAVAAVVAVVAVDRPIAAPTAPPTPTVDVPRPPSGMQWISYRSLTFTVPASWSVAEPSCWFRPTTATVLVYGFDPTTTSPPNCPSQPGAVTPSPPSTTIVLRPLAPSTTTGEPVTFGGLTADRSTSFGADSTVVTRYDFATAEVTLIVERADPDVEQALQAGLSSAPVNPLGCADQTSPAASPSLPYGRITAPASGPVVVCQYGSPTDGEPWLIGSRTLTAHEASKVRSVLGEAGTFPGGDAAGLAVPRDLLTYVFPTNSESVVVTANRGASSIIFTGEGVTAPIETGGTPQLPTVFP